MRAMLRASRILGCMSLVAALLALLAPVSARATAAAPSARVAGAPPAAKAAAHSVLPWIADDYTRAVAEAKARKVPIFVESWAPW